MEEQITLEDIAREIGESPVDMVSYKIDFHRGRKDISGKHFQVNFGVYFSRDHNRDHKAVDIERRWREKGSGLLPGNLYRDYLMVITTFDQKGEINKIIYFKDEQVKPIYESLCKRIFETTPDEQEALVLRAALMEGCMPDEAFHHLAK